MKGRELGWTLEHVPTFQSWDLKQLTFPRRDWNFLFSKRAGVMGASQTAWPWHGLCLEYNFQESSKYLKIFDPLTVLTIYKCCMAWQATILSTPLAKKKLWAFERSSKVGSLMVPSELTTTPPKKHTNSCPLQ